MSSNVDKKLNKLPDKPGVYLFKDAREKIIYIGKAVSLKRRVKSYFARAHDIKTEALVAEITDLETRETPSAIEALILESELIKKYKPKFNIREKDDKSFIYVGITREDFPKPILIRGHELQVTVYKLQAKYGPFTSTSSLRAALKILRAIFPWSECKPNQGRPCFYRGIKRCPGVCTGEVTKAEYNKNIRNLKLFFRGKRGEVLRNLERQMKEASKAERFERAAELRNNIYALKHIRDTSLITKDDINLSPDKLKYNIMGRIEGYDISNISQQMAVGSMVVFESGKPKKSEYRKFRIKNTKAGDVPMLKEVLSRRFKRSAKNKSKEVQPKKEKAGSHNSYFMIHDSQIWPLPNLIIIDGGEGQVSAAKEIIKNKIPVIGLAKGLKRKNDRFVFDYKDPELKRLTKSFENLFKQVRDEAHRFAIKYHRELRGRRLTK